MATKVTYKGETLTTVRNDTKTLKTGGTWVEGDIGITDESGTAVVAVEDVPDSHGGIEKRITAVDISDTDATASDVAQGKVFYSNTGTRTVGTAVNAEWTTEGIAHNTEPNGAVRISGVMSNQYRFTEDFALFGKPITSIVFDASNARVSVATFGNKALGRTKIKEITDASFVNVSEKNITIEPYSAFQEMTSLEKVDTTVLFKCIYGQPFYACKALKYVSLVNAYGTSYGYFQECNALEFVDFGNIETINGNTFLNNYALQTVILRNTTLVSLTTNPTSTFRNTPFLGYNDLSGKIYVPQALISDYQTATNWSTLYNAGHCEFVAIEGSEYEL